MKLMRISQSGKKDFNWVKDVYLKTRKPAIPKNQVMDEGKHGPRPSSNTFEPDIPDIDTLKQEAIVSCEIRGHTMGNWKPFNVGNRNYASNSCLVCGKDVQVCDKPLPNEIDIGGLAVSLNCDQE